MRFVPLLLAAATLGGCAGLTNPPPARTAPAAPLAIETILRKQIYQMTPVEAGRYVA